MECARSYFRITVIPSADDALGHSELHLCLVCQDCKKHLSIPDLPLNQDTAPIFSGRHFSKCKLMKEHQDGFACCSWTTGQDSFSCGPNSIHHSYLFSTWRCRHKTICTFPHRIRQHFENFIPEFHLCHQSISRFGSLVACSIVVPLFDCKIWVGIYPMSKAIKIDFPSRGQECALCAVILSIIVWPIVMVVLSKGAYWVFQILKSLRRGIHGLKRLSITKNCINSPRLVILVSGKMVMVAWIERHNGVAFTLLTANWVSASRCSGDNDFANELLLKILNHEIVLGVMTRISFYVVFTLLCFWIHAQSIKFDFESMTDSFQVNSSKILLLHRLNTIRSSILYVINGRLQGNRWSRWSPRHFKECYTVNSGRNRERKP